MYIAGQPMLGELALISYCIYINIAGQPMLGEHNRCQQVPYLVITYLVITTAASTYRTFGLHNPTLYIEAASRYLPWARILILFINLGSFSNILHHLSHLSFMASWVSFMGVSQCKVRVCT